MRRPARRARLPPPASGGGPGAPVLESIRLDGASCPRSPKFLLRLPTATDRSRMRPTEGKKAARSTSRARGRARLADPMLASVLALGITQITAWGTSYYCLGVLAGPIVHDTGWSRGFVFLGFTVALLVMGLVSSTVGRMIDRHGAR